MRILTLRSRIIMLLNQAWLPFNKKTMYRLDIELIVILWRVAINLGDLIMLLLL